MFWGGGVLTKAYTYACCHVVIVFLSFSSLLLKFTIFISSILTSLLLIFLLLKLVFKFMGYYVFVHDRNFSDTEFTVYSCTNNFIMVFKLCMIFKQLCVYIYIYIHTFRLILWGVCRWKLISHFWFFIFTP